ncbi:MAG: stage II sporulation protein P [Bacillota bacterium]
MKTRIRLILIIIIYVLLSSVVFAEHTEDDVMTVYDYNGNYIFSIAMAVREGDRYISQNNIEYVVESVLDKKAIAKQMGKVDLLENLQTETGISPLIAEKGEKVIGIYHTHNGESYKPGPDSIRSRGEIHEVGKSLKAALDKKGIKVIHSENLHLPHDGAAYERSRQTALQITRNEPDAIFDIHRDAIPRVEDYLKTVAGHEISQVRIVVGRQNPNRKVNDQFARNLKGISDKQYPGLIRDIFYGSGAYNQEFSPHSLLLEFGTHVTTKDQAQKSATMLADSINQLLYGAGAVNTAEENTSSFTTIAWILGILIIGIFTFLFINEGSWQGVKKRIKGFFGKEILDRGDNE